MYLRGAGNLHAGYGQVISAACVPGSRILHGKMGAFENLRGIVLVL
jgi:hypothetical protein